MTFSRKKKKREQAQSLEENPMGRQGGAGHCRLSRLPTWLGCCTGKRLLADLPDKAVSTKEASSQGSRFPLSTSSWCWAAVSGMCQVAFRPLEPKGAWCGPCRTHGLSGSCWPLPVAGKALISWRRGYLAPEEARVTAALATCSGRTRDKLKEGSVRAAV